MGGAGGGVAAVGGAIGGVAAVGGAKGLGLGTVLGKEWERVWRGRGSAHQGGVAREGRGLYRVLGQ